MLSSRENVNREIMLYLNKQLFLRGLISESVFRNANVKIVSDTFPL